MDWMTLSGGVPCVSLISLGTFYGGKYYIGDDCLYYLDEIVNRLNTEDPTSRPLRRALGFMDILNKDLIPILIDSKDQPAIFQTTIKLLVGLTVPVECLVAVDASNQSPTSQHMVHELTQLLYTAKEAFLDPRATRTIVDHLHRLLEKQPLSTEGCEAVNYSLLLLRNILHAPERPPMQEPIIEESTDPPSPGNNANNNNDASNGERRGSRPSNEAHTPYLGPHVHSHGYSSDCSQQNRLLWNLFAQGLDRLLINMLSSPHKEEWVVTIVQLIALFYKDQHVENMQKMLSSWLDSTTSDSSEDDESNTSPPIGPCNSPQMLTSSSDPTSDSSDSAQRNGSASNGADSAEKPDETIPADGKSNSGSSNSASSGTGSVRKNHHKGSADSASSSSHFTTHSKESRRSSVSSGFHSENSFGSGQSEKKGSEVSKNGKPATPEESKRSASRSHGNSSSVTTGATASKSSKNNSARSEETSAPNLLGTIGIDSSVAMSNESVGSDRAAKSSTQSATCTTAAGSTTAAAAAANNSPLIGRNSAAASPETEVRRKKILSKRSRTTRHIKMKAIVQCTPTEDDISQLLKEFTVDFLLNGYNTLVGELHKQLLRHESLPLDKSHFLWLITYFLRFASQLELDLEHLRSILSVELLCFLTWDAVMETEQFEMSLMQPTTDLKPCLRRLHLGVTALREFLQALETYSRLTHLSSEDHDKIVALRGKLPAIRDLRHLFLLQLRHYNPVIQSRRYLRDIITTNHVLILSLERAIQQSCYEGNFDLRQHLNKFCSRTILDNYGIALEDFKTNGRFVNDCILTVLHHIGADLDRPDLLCEPMILRSFSKIWEDDFNMCDDWDDLIEYIVHKFLRFHTRQQNSDFDSVGSPKSSDVSHGSRWHGSEAVVDSHGDPPDQAQFLESLRAEGLQDDVEGLKCRLIELGFGEQLHGIQSALLTACSVRLGTYRGQEFKEPIACLSHEMNVACPMVPWTDLEAAALRSELYLFLLHRMGLLPENTVGLFPRIPHEWDADTLYSVALYLGPVEQQHVDFDLKNVHQVDLPLPNSADMPIGPNQHWLPPYMGPGPSTSFSVMPHHWLYWVEASGSLFRSAEKTSHGHSSHSISNYSHRPMDSVSTTSSLEVHKTNSSDDEEMEDNHPVYKTSGAGYTNEPLSSMDEDPGDPWFRTGCDPATLVVSSSSESCAEVFTSHSPNVEVSSDTTVAPPAVEPKTVKRSTSDEDDDEDDEGDDEDDDQ